MNRRLSRDTLKPDLFREIQKEDVRAKVDIVSLFSSFGVRLEKKGSSYTGLCPFHDDHNPSLSVSREKGVYNCFGCGASGDCFDLVMQLKGLDFKGALSYLKNTATHAGIPPVVTTTGGQTEDKKDSVIDEPPAPSVSLDEIASYYHKQLTGNKEAMNYLKSRGITDRRILADFQVGFADGSLAEKLSKKQKQELTGAGIFSENGSELLEGYITVPLTDRAGRSVNFYGRKIAANGSRPAHRYLSGPMRGLLNPRAFTVYSDQLVFTESVIDALSLFALGLENVTACYGVNGFTPDHLEAVKEHRLQRAVIAFDADAAGEAGAAKLKEKLLAEGVAVKTIAPAVGKDWNEYLLAGKTADAVKEQIAQAKTAEPKRSSQVVFCKENGRYVTELSGVSYRLSGVKEGFTGSLKVNMRAQKDDELFVDNVDLYSARSRSSFAGNIFSVFGVEAARVEKDLLAMLCTLEEERDRRLTMEDGEEIVLTAEDEKLGMELLTAPDLFDRIPSDLAALGYVGEDVNKLLLYLAASSRKLDDPMSVIVLSESASGKSFLVDTVKKLIPPEDVVSMTSLSDQALNYLPAEGLLHKFLVMGEAVHGEVVEHQVREMLSAKELSRLVTTKDEKTGELTSRMVRKQVIVSAVMSSTNYDLNAENASRCFVVNTDESVQQTRNIHRMQRQKYSLQRYKRKKEQLPSIITAHHAAQRLLKPRVIVNPFADLLDFPASMMRARRDHERFIDLIAAVCFLRQFQKEEKEAEGVQYIACDLEDYQVAHRIMTAVLPSTLMNFPKSAMRLYSEVRKILKKKAEREELGVTEASVSQREVREATDFNQRFIKRYMKVLCDFEYLKAGGMRTRGSRNLYSLVADEEIRMVDMSMVPTPEEMDEKLKNV